MKKNSLIHFIKSNINIQKDILLQIAGSLFSIVVICSLFNLMQAEILIPSFGASIIILYSAYHTQAAHPRSLFWGHILSCIIGIAIGSLTGNVWLSVTLTLVLCYSLMALTNTTHPPAGGTGLAVALNHQVQLFIIAKLALGVFTLLLSVLIIDKFILKINYLDIWLSKDSSNQTLQISKKNIPKNIH